MLGWKGLSGHLYNAFCVVDVVVVVVAVVFFSPVLILRIISQVKFSPCSSPAVTVCSLS